MNSESWALMDYTSGKTAIKDEAANYVHECVNFPVAYYLKGQKWTNQML